MIHFVQLGNLYKDKDKRNLGRVLKVIKIGGVKVLCSVGYMNDCDEWYETNHSTKIRIDRLYNKNCFEFIDSLTQIDSES